MGKSQEKPVVCKKQTESRNMKDNKKERAARGTVTQNTVTRDTVARLAGVSSATVSRVFNGSGSVAGERRRAVLEAAETLGYRPNKSASALRRNGTGIITFVEFPKPSRKYYWGLLPDFSWFYGEIIKGIQACLAPTMYQLNMASASSAAALKAAAAESDGLICFDIDMLEEAERVRSLGVPYIIAHHTRTFSGCNRCSTDNRIGGRLQAEQLYAAGVRNPLYVTGLTSEVEPHAERLQGFEDYWAEAGICPGTSLASPQILEAAPGGRGGYDAAKTAADKIRSGNCDGIAAVNDVTLIGLLNGLAAQGLEQQISRLPFCGYDAVPFRNLLPYRFASIDIQPGKLYYRAAELLLSQLSGSRLAQTQIEEIFSPLAVPVISEQPQLPGTG